MVAALMLLLVAACAPYHRGPAVDPHIERHASETRTAPSNGFDVEAYRRTEPERADSILVLKSERKMHLLADGEPIRSYRVALGFEPKGHKIEKGDGRTPEGRYVLDFHNENSRFHRSIRVSYPNVGDRLLARARGVDPGGNIMIHGLPNGSGSVGASHAWEDWTEGCIAVTNEEIDEILQLVGVGTPIEIRP
jgi:murein L,D-transpeptidase YafK